MPVVPITTFDAAYSDPAATASGWEETRKVLEEAELFWVSTVRADGRPHVTPVVAVWPREPSGFPLVPMSRSSPTCAPTRMW
jgi:predicted pyridoxine 5'-phosphate oxidase superfamily flavin-nucleotide-binding protein